MHGELSAGSARWRAPKPTLCKISYWAAKLQVYGACFRRAPFAWCAGFFQEAWGVLWECAVVKGPDATLVQDPLLGRPSCKWAGVPWLRPACGLHEQVLRPEPSGG